MGNKMTIYTNEEIKQIIDIYSANPCLDTVVELSKQFNKPERSIISKLSALGVYKKKVYVSKLGEPPVKKEIYIERIAKLLDIDVQLLESLEKVTKYALVLMDKKIESIKSK